MSAHQTLTPPGGVMPLRMKAESVAPAEQMADVRRRVARMLVLAEAAECWINEHRGSELDRDQMLDFIDLIAEQAEAITVPTDGGAP